MKGGNLGRIQLRSNVLLFLIQNTILVCMVITYSRVRINRGKVANLARAQRNRENEYPPVPVCA